MRNYPKFACAQEITNNTLTHTHLREQAEYMLYDNQVLNLGYSLASSWRKLGWQQRNESWFSSDSNENLTVN